MNDREQMNKAFDDFDKACVVAMKACQDFIDMDINKTTPYERKRLEPLPASKLGCPRSP